MKELIKFEDFAKLEIRIGTIVSVEKILNSDRLLKIIINFGTEKKQVVAGFGHIHTDTENLVGKQVPIITNIAPALMRGTESQGILLALDDENATLLTPIQKVADGTKIK